MHEPRIVVFGASHEGGDMPYLPGGARAMPFDVAIRMRDCATALARRFSLLGIEAEHA